MNRGQSTGKLFPVKTICFIHSEALRPDGTNISHRRSADVFGRRAVL
jgi:hypothetical protein